MVKTLLPQWSKAALLCAALPSFLTNTGSASQLQIPESAHVTFYKNNFNFKNIDDITAAMLVSIAHTDGRYS